MNHNLEEEARELRKVKGSATVELMVDMCRVSLQICIDSILAENPGMKEEQILEKLRSFYEATR